MGGAGRGKALASCEQINAARWEDAVFSTCLIPNGLKNSEARYVYKSAEEHVEATLRLYSLIITYVL